jgi:hypothetical protein
MALHHQKKSERFLYIIATWKAHPYSRKFDWHLRNFPIDARVQGHKKNGTWDLIVKKAKYIKRMRLYDFPAPTNFDSPAQLYIKPC